MVDTHGTRVYGLSFAKIGSRLKWFKVYTVRSKGRKISNEKSYGIIRKP